MKPRQPSRIPLTYCLSIHGGESASDVLRVIRHDAAAVREELVRQGLVENSTEFPMGLRIGARAAREFREPSLRQTLRTRLHEAGGVAITLNGFPYGPFHGRPVKRRVYQPDWSSPLRLAYTLDLADLLADLLPEGTPGSISTVPVSYRTEVHQAPETACANLAEAAAALRDLENRTGKEIGLALEPEPDCLLECASDAISFFRNRLHPIGRSVLGGSADEAERTLRRHLGVCLDTCHHSVVGESPAAPRS